MQVKKQQLEPNMENRLVPNWARSASRLYVVTLLYLTYMQSTLCEMPGWMKHKLESRLPGEISITSDMHISAHTTLMAKSEEEPKNLLIIVGEESEKTGLKLNIHKTKIMASYPITSWQIDGENVETVTDFIFLDFKIIAGGDFSHEIKRRLLLGRKAMTNLDSILKSKDITLLTKVHVLLILFLMLIVLLYLSVLTVR